MKKNIFLVLLFFGLISCTSTQSTIKNIDNNAPNLKLIDSNTFLISEFSNDKKYGFDPDYPVNIFYANTKNPDLNAQRFLNALAGPNGEIITYKKLESCCPFPSKTTEMGAGLLDVYEIKWAGQKTSIKLYINPYEKGYVLVPVGLGLKK